MHPSPAELHLNQQNQMAAATVAELGSRAATIASLSARTAASVDRLATIGGPLKYEQQTVSVGVVELATADAAAFRFWLPGNFSTALSIVARLDVPDDPSTPSWLWASMVTTFDPAHSAVSTIQAHEGYVFVLAGKGSIHWRAHGPFAPHVGLAASFRDSNITPSRVIAGRRDRVSMTFGALLG